VSFAAIILCVASQREFVVVYFFIDSVRKVLDAPSCASMRNAHNMKTVNNPSKMLQSSCI
jgi:hypothetical protein